VPLGRKDAVVARDVGRPICELDSQCVAREKGRGRDGSEAADEDGRRCVLVCGWIIEVLEHAAFSETCEC
jgi:hypothetical protein